MAEQSDNHPNLDTALDLARAGLFVFPCQPSGPSIKSPCKGIYWRSVSTTDEKKIYGMWAKYPDAIPGIDLAKSQLLVLDCDKKLNDGLAWFTEYAAKHDDDLSATPIVDTPTKGRHHFYRNTFEPPHGNGRGKLPPKTIADIDVRGSGGFVIGPGAVSEAGTYMLYGSLLDATAPPPWLVELLSGHQGAVAPANEPAEPVADARKDAYGRAALTAMVAELTATPSGARSDTAFKIAARAGELVGSDCLGYDDTYNALAEAALSWGIRKNDKALGRHGTLARGLAQGMKNPKGPMSFAEPEVELLLPQIVAHLPNAIQLPGTPIVPLLKELPEHLTRPPGLLGTITDWITDTALYPQRSLSLGAALTIVGTAAGRHIAGPLRCGTHLYVVGLAMSGAGKNHPLSSIATILNASGMREHVGPSQFISMPAVINFMVRKPLAVCAMDEFGSFLKRVNNKRASGFEGAISGMLRTIWGSSFTSMATPEWAQKESVTIHSPALSIFGISTVREFYDSLEGADITNGILNRFLLIETKTRPEEREPLLDPSKVPANITEPLAAIYGQAGPLSMLSQSSIAPAHESLQISPEANEMRKKFVRILRERGVSDQALEPYLARTAENALRLATIATIGMRDTIINVPVMEWAIEFATWSSETLAESAGLYIADSDSQALANAVRRVLTERGGKATKKDLLRSLAHRYKRRELEDTLLSLAESETILVHRVKQDMTKPGPPTTWYILNTD